PPSRVRTGWSRLAADGRESAWVSPGEKRRTPPSVPSPTQHYCAPATMRAITGRSNLRRDLLKADHAREVANLALLVLAKPHQERHRGIDQFLNFGAVGIDVDLAADRLPA